MSEMHVFHPGNVNPVTGLNYGPYKVVASGVNSGGNRWFRLIRLMSNDIRRGYRYLNKDGSVYYRNWDGSQYYNNGRGRSRYTSPSGEVTSWYS